MNRRSLLLASSAATLAPLTGLSSAQAAPPIAPQHPLQAVWRAWSASHLTNDGRVVDGPQSNVSHSEGQGYGMTLAVRFGDDKTFRRMFGWTERRLAVRPDALLAWRWFPDAANQTPDRNNASDGDLFYAWALTLAAEAFGERAYAIRAKDIATDLAERCIAANPTGRGRVLLPAADGFATERGVTINPSYYMPRAMKEVAQATGVDELAACAEDGDQLLREVSENGLTPDWVALSSTGWRIPDAVRGRSGYEALRVPLFLTWSGAADHSAVRRAVSAHRAAKRQPSQKELAKHAFATPTIFDRTNAEVLERSDDAGYAAIIGLADCAAHADATATVPPFDAQQPYYPATLHVFALLALLERQPTCVPV